MKIKSQEAAEYKSAATEPKIESRITDSKSARSAIVDLLTDENRNTMLFQEVCGVVALNRQNKVLGMKITNVGQAAGVEIDFPTMFRYLFNIPGCNRFVFFHNHPSNDPTPSPHDIAATRRIYNAGEILSFELLDSIVLGSPYKALGPYCSLRDMGLLN